MEMPYIVGGVPRDYSIFGSATIGGSSSGISSRAVDLDMTTNSSDSMRLAILFASRNDLRFRIFDDRHVTVFLKNFNVDFSSNYISKNVIDFLKSEQCTEYLCPAFPEIEEKALEIYSRDFTINALHQNIRTGEIVDILDRSLKDIEDKKITTILPPEITLLDDPRRVFRAIRFSTKFGFSIDEDIKQYVKNNKHILSSSSVKDGYISSEISMSMKYNSDETIKALKDMDILGMIPMTGDFKEYIIKNKLVIDYLDSSIA